MRRSLLFGGLEAIAYNSNRKKFDQNLFEFGFCYSKISDNFNEEIKKQFLEEEHLALFLSGNKTMASWNLKVEPTNIFYLKGYVEGILAKIGININAINIEEINNQFFNSGLNYSYQKKSIVEFGVVSKKLQKKFDLENEVFYADFHWNNIISSIGKNKILFTEIPKYPEVKRDLALLIDKNIKFEQIKNLAYKTERKLLQNVSLFDVYEGKQIADNKKSYAISFILQDMYKTLTDKQIDKIMKKFIFAFKNEFDAEIR
jgi:phenylalanyl-tRNA synthetase beta chain